MAITLPLIAERKTVGTCFVGGKIDDTLLFITVLHHLGKGREFSVGMPPHIGDMSVPQPYPLKEIPALEVDLIYADPIYDLAVLKAKSSQLKAPLPRYIMSFEDVKIGQEVLVMGYPYIGIGSFLETAESRFVSALGNRLFMEKVPIPEIIISGFSRQSSAGSPMVRKSDGLVCGIVRGSFVPPEMVAAGNIPAGLDANVTYSISGHIIPGLVSEAVKG